MSRGGKERAVGEAEVDFRPWQEAIINCEDGQKKCLCKVTFEGKGIVYGFLEQDKTSGGEGHLRIVFKVRNKGGCADSVNDTLLRLLLETGKFNKNVLTSKNLDSVIATLGISDAPIDCALHCADYRDAGFEINSLSIKTAASHSLGNVSPSIQNGEQACQIAQGYMSAYPAMRIEPVSPREFLDMKRKLAKK